MPRATKDSGIASDATGALASENCSAALERVVAHMADGYKWNWTRALSQRDTADRALCLMVDEGLIEGANHPYGGLIFRVNGKLYGRTDGITNKKFDALLRQND